MAGVQVVAGGAGFIGSGLVRELLRQEHSEIVILDDLSLGRVEYIRESMMDQRVRLIECDIADRGAINDALRSRRSGVTSRKSGTWLPTPTFQLESWTRMWISIGHSARRMSCCARFA